jgi:hypothetical protein
LRKLILVLLFGLLLFSNGRDMSTPIHIGAHEAYHLLGADISFTPITYDMAGAWNSGEDFLINDIFLKLSNKEHKKIWPINELNLYTVKLPFLLCFELYPKEQIKGTQCFSSLCKIGDKLLTKEVENIEVFSGDPKKSKTLVEVKCRG